MLRFLFILNYFPLITGGFGIGIGLGLGQGLGNGII